MCAIPYSSVMMKKEVFTDLDQNFAATLSQGIFMLMSKNVNNTFRGDL